MPSTPDCWRLPADGVSPAVRTGQVGPSRVRLPTAQKLPCPTREMSRALCGLIVFTKPPHLLNFSLCGHHECWGCYFLSSQFLSFFQRLTKAIREMGANKDPSSNVKCRSVLYLAPGTMQMATEKLPYVDARPGPTAGAARSTVRPPMATGSQSCVNLLRAAASQPRDSPEL